MLSLYGPYIRAVYTGDRYALPVHTARTYGPYVRAVCTGVKNAPVYTGRKYGPYIRVLGIHIPVQNCCFVRAVYTGRIYGCQENTRIYGPYIRPVYTGRIYG